ncbi:MAG: DNA helicase RecQ [Gimesia sp.]|uniref:DNA helicase RecQ n=1 Tax=Gimesia maris TaxID=122 RepID=A0A3D3RH15_9PLAN|nr:DNA helicase RecQ [Gimesia sp.]HCO26910.1 DNA helicase RecQ [Gimesia maris]|tara:strand:+ start:280 stop:2115 length:1836 start_codon:yes stop_codon:yes gene_type:complete
MTRAGMDDALLDVLHEYWGYAEFRPLQQEAMTAVLDDRDSLVVLPTGGGKSLCYQAPALCREGTAVVVSPLISLMKDQVDALRVCGISAACLNSSLDQEESRQVLRDVRAGKIKLLYVAPERLMLENMLCLLAEINLTYIVIDEAHCVSMWGHDFRPHYRELSELKNIFPQCGIHAYTATATEEVRSDIAVQLGLKTPEILIGSFDRPNLTYSVARRADRFNQVCAVLDRHPGEPGVIYCISRADVESLSESLNDAGYETRPYHAGLEDRERAANQEAFIQDRVDVIVATIAFGMGIDKPNVRYVIHAGLPKSLENYQQESGRAGRDGLEAECVLLYSEQDAMIWKRILEDQPDESKASALQSLQAMQNYCHAFDCRHRYLMQHFGQDLEQDCETGCDLCRGDFQKVEDAQVIGQKILSSIFRQDQNFGASYTAAVLKGSKDKKVLANGHDKLSTYGLLKTESLATIRHWINQLVSQGYLTKTAEYQQLRITKTGRQLLKGEITPQLMRTTETSKSETNRAPKNDLSQLNWKGVDQDLFESLRLLRKQIAGEKGIQPYMVFGDATLRELARHKPQTIPQFLEIWGVGQKKCDDFGQQFLDCIATQPDQPSS